MPTPYYITMVNDDPAAVSLSPATAKLAEAQVRTAQYQRAAQAFGADAEQMRHHMERLHIHTRLVLGESPCAPGSPSQPSSI